MNFKDRFNAAGYFCEVDRGVLVWDSASAHCAKDMKNFLAERRIDQIMNCAGVAAYLQTLDISVNKPIKEINDYIENIIGD